MEAKSQCHLGHEFPCGPQFPHWKGGGGILSVSLASHDGSLTTATSLSLSTPEGSPDHNLYAEPSQVSSFELGTASGSLKSDHCHLCLWTQWTGWVDVTLKL